MANKFLSNLSLTWVCLGLLTNLKLSMSLHCWDLVSVECLQHSYFSNWVLVVYFVELGDDRSRSLVTKVRVKTMIREVECNQKNRLKLTSLLWVQSFLQIFIKFLIQYPSKLPVCVWIAIDLKKVVWWFLWFCSIEDLLSQ